MSIFEMSFTGFWSSISVAGFDFSQRNTHTNTQTHTHTRKVICFLFIISLTIDLRELPLCKIKGKEEQVLLCYLKVSRSLKHTATESIWDG